MTLPSSGTLSMSQIRTEWKGSGTWKLSNCYTTLVSGIPSSGTIKFSNLRGKTLVTRQPSSGERYDSDDDTFHLRTDDRFPLYWTVRWMGSTIDDHSGDDNLPSSVTKGSYTYYRGNLRASTSAGKWYGIYRIGPP